MEDLRPWRQQFVVGFVDESGNMSARVGEIHTISGIFLPADQVEIARNLATELRASVTSRIDPRKPIKARELSREALLRFTSAFRANCWMVYHKKTHVTDLMPHFQQNVMQKLEGDIRTLQGLLSGNDRMDLAPDFAIEQLRREREHNPIYFELFYWSLAHMADHFRKERLIPLLRIYYDRKLAPTSGTLANLMMRVILYGRFADIGKYTAADIFGFTRRKPFNCHISSDDIEPGLFLADIAAHVIGNIDRGNDQDGFYSNLYRRMGLPANKDVA